MSETHTQNSGQKFFFVLNILFGLLELQVNARAWHAFARIRKPKKTSGQIMNVMLLIQILQAFLTEMLDYLSPITLNNTLLYCKAYKTLYRCPKASGLL